MTCSPVPTRGVQRDLQFADHEFETISEFEVFGHSIRQMGRGGSLLCAASATLGVAVLVDGADCRGFKIPATARNMHLRWKMQWSCLLYDVSKPPFPFIISVVMWHPDDAGNVPGRMAVTAAHTDAVLLYELPPTHYIMCHKRIPCVAPSHVAARGTTMVVATLHGDVHVMEQREEDRWVSLRIVGNLGFVGSPLLATHVWLSSDGKEFCVERQWPGEYYVFGVATGEVMGQLVCADTACPPENAYEGGWTVDHMEPTILTHRGRAGERQFMAAPNMLVVGDNTLRAIMNPCSGKMEVSTSTKQMEAMSGHRVGWMVAVARAIAHREVVHCPGAHKI